MTTIEGALITFVAASLGLALAVSAVGGDTGSTTVLATAHESITAGAAPSLKTSDNSD